MASPLALLVNDLHISNDNISEFNRNWDEVIRVCKKRKIEDIFIGGDVFTSRSSQGLGVLLAVQRAFEVADMEGISVVVANGNHDKPDYNATEGYCNLYKYHRNVEVVDYVKLITWDDLDFAVLMVAYYPETGKFVEILQEQEEKAKSAGYRKKDLILYIHEGIHGALGDFEAKNECPQGLFDGYHSVLVGHYHNRIRIKKTCIEYIGSSRQNNFGEDEEKGYTILFDDGTTKFVKNEVNMRYAVIDVDADDLDNALDEIPDPNLYRTKLRISASESASKNIDRNKLLEIEGISKVEVVVKKGNVARKKKSDMSVKFDKEGIRKEYRSFCGVKEIDSELGLKYLD